MLRFSDARNFGRTATGLALIVGPLVLLVSAIVDPQTDHKNKLEELAAVAANKGRYLLAGLLWLTGAIILMLAAVGLVKMFRGPRGVTLGQVAGVLLLFGAAVSFGWYAFGTVEYEMVNQQGIDRAAMAKLLDKADMASSGLPLFILFIVGIVLALVLLGIAAWRTGVVPRWAAALIAASGPIAFFSEGRVGSIVSFAILTVALGSLGWQALGMSDEEWDTPGHAAASPGDAAASAAPAAAV